MTDADGNATSATATARDTTAPEIVDVNISAAGDRVSGKTEPGASIELGGGATGATTAGSDGTFSMGVAPALTNGEVITVTATDGAGNFSSSTVRTGDSTTPVLDNVVINAAGDRVSGATEAGATVQLTGAATHTVHAAADGTFHFDLDPALTNGEALTVTARDAAQNERSKGLTAPDTTRPTLRNVKLSAGRLHITGETEPGVRVAASANSLKASGTASADGVFGLQLASRAPAGVTISVVATDAVGNESETATVSASPEPAVEAQMDTTNPERIASRSVNAESVIITVTDAGTELRRDETLTGVDGSWSYFFPTPPAAGQEVGVQVKAHDGTLSALVTLLVKAKDDSSETSKSPDKTTGSGGTTKKSSKDTDSGKNTDKPSSKNTSQSSEPGNTDDSKDSDNESTGANNSDPADVSNGASKDRLANTGAAVSGAQSGALAFCMAGFSLLVARRRR